ncbi:MAG: MFS transporter [Acidimicrobiia bacterium]|nr:MFS transporter [Acidimicrobiia bacterium]
MRPPSLTRLLVVAVLVVTASTQAVFLLGAGFVQIGPELDLGPVGLGALTAAFFLTASATSAPLGRWVARVGWQHAMVLNTRISAVVLLTIAAAARNTWTLAGLLIAAAAIYGAANPAANQALADHTDPKRRATIFGAKHGGIPASTLLAGLAVPVVIVQFGWRWAYVAAAALAVAVSFLIPRVTFEIGHPAESDDPTDARRVRLSTRQLLALAVGSSFATWGAIALGTFLVSAAVDAGFSESAAGTLQFAGSGMSIAARVFYGVLTDRFGGRGFAAMVALTLTGSVAFFILPLVGGAAFTALVIVAFATGWAWPGLLTFAVVNANRGTVATSSAITQAGIFLGAGAGPLVLGAAIERWSFSGAWVAAGIGLIVSSVVVGSVGVRTAAR